MLNAIIIILFLVPYCRAGIFGLDDRKNFYEMPPDKQVLAKSTVAIVSKKMIKKNPNGNFTLTGNSLIKMFNFCDDENFSHESHIANCSASLIKDDVILTAAHCVPPEDIAKYVAVFNYKINANSLFGLTISSHDVVELDSHLFYQFDLPFMKIDLALIKLKSTVSYPPLKVNFDVTNILGDAVFMLGFPLGIAQKLSDNAFVLGSNWEQFSFRANLDGFSCNSGSPVFDEKTNSIIGVFVRGTGVNYYEDPKNKCNRWSLSDVSKGDWQEVNYLPLTMQSLL